MAKLSLMDKISVLLNITSSSKVFIVVILSLVFLAFIFITTNKKNYKSSKMIYISIYAIIMASLLFAYRSSLANMVDYLMNNLFIAIYFPNFAIYLVGIVLSNIILWSSIFKDKTNKIIKVINVIVYCIMTYILILILNTINSNNLDVYTQSSIYGNTDALALIELSSTIFITWIVFLLVYKGIRHFQKNNKKQVIKEQPRVMKSQQPRVTMPKSYRLVEAPYFIRADRKNITVEQNKKAYSDLLTLEDYKLLLNILSEHKKEEQNKQVIKQPEKIEILEDTRTKTIVEQSKFQQLQDMYRSVR